MQIFALVFIRCFPLIIVGALIFSVIYYVLMVFNVIDRLMLEYLSLGFLDASGLYIKLAFFSLLFAPIIIFLKSRIVNKSSQVYDDYMLGGFLCFVSFYLILISTLVFYAIVHLALLRSSYLLMLLALSPLLIGLIFVASFSVMVLYGFWKESVGTMKIIMLSSLCFFSTMVI
ncbi:hypothetical protein SAMN04515657_1553 [Idiomarina abyssalis]|nr:hypothetical protein ADS78_05565 [Idiomarina abyssalis]SFT65834.1 hypothetical protein SAMN04515657_1553 [Idiomarina abyssalis]